MKKKGFQLVEYFFSIFIIIFITSFFSIKIINFKRKLQIKEAVVKIVGLVDKYTFKSFMNREYEFLFDSLEKKIEVYDLSEKKILERTKLPKELEYKIPYNFSYQRKFRFYSTINNNLSKSFSLYIFLDNKVQRKIAFYSFRESKIIKINIYKRNYKKNLTKEDILKDYKNSNDKGWIRIYDY